MPEAEEVEPWVETIIRLWDDEALYAEQSARARKEAERWHPDRLRPLYAEFFRNVRPAAGRTGDRGGRPRQACGRRTGAKGAAHPSPTATVPMSFVVCVSDDAVLKANLLASPWPRRPGFAAPGHLDPRGTQRRRRAGHGLGESEASGGSCASTRMSTCPTGWDRRLAEQLAEAERRFGPIGVAGVYGVGEVITPADVTQPLAAERVGWVVDRGRMLRDGPELPARVATLDESAAGRAAGFAATVRSGAGVSPLWGGPLPPGARTGLAVVALGALCHHNSRSVGLPEAFYQSAGSSPANGATGCRSRRRA